MFFYTITMYHSKRLTDVHAHNEHETINQIQDHKKLKDQISITKHEWGIGSYNEPKTIQKCTTMEAAFCDVVIWGILSIFQASGKYLFIVIRSLKINNLMLSVLQLLHQNGLFM
jgi:hypothetical protein